jgi:AbrB family looped-hinge helix DNA binding protein
LTVVTTSSKGQVVIPQKERARIGIRLGSRVVVKAVGDHIEIHLLPENPVEYFCGIFKKGSSLTRALLKERKENLKREGKKGREICLALEGPGLDKSFVEDELCSKLSQDGGKSHF